MKERNILWVLALAIAAMGFSGCAEEEGEGESCVTNQQFFAEQVWSQVLGPKCIACHNPQGEARETRFILQDAYQTGFLDANYSTFENVAKYDKDGEPLLLLKPTGGDDHDGGAVIQKDSPEYKALEDMIARLDKPVGACNSEERTVTDDLVLMTPRETLRKASLALVGRLPTDSEIQIVEEAGMTGVDAVLEKMMEEQAFYTRLKEVYNDLYLTDRYLPGDEATDLLDSDDYPNRQWYDPDEDDPPSNIDQSYMDLGDRYANRSVAREVLELVSHVVRNDRPFTEILLADYVMVNPFSARVYGIEGAVEFNDPTDPTEFREGRIPGVPHAGVLTSHMWLNRFPTTDTNVNRHRSRMVWEFFLATDVLKLAERPIDPTSIEVHNPTMNSEACNVCHAVIDPIAGSFQNWDDEGRYRPPEEGWHPDMLAPGFGGEDIPIAEYESSLQWLGERIATDRRFVTATVHTWYQALTGRAPLRAPTDFSADDYGLRMENYLEQDAAFAAIGDQFVESNYNLKTIIRGIVASDYYRAKNVRDFDPATADEEDLQTLEGYGMGHFLTPEQLNRKIVAVTGYPWRPRSDDQDYLLDMDEYRIFYGGIDSDSVTVRINEPNGLMSNIASRMGNQMACLAVPQDFALPQDQRLLFPHVKMNFAPEDQNGFAVPESVQAIKQNIQYLHAHVLGEELDINDPAIDRTYRLFVETWKEGRAKVASEELGNDLDGDCRADDNYWTGEDYMTNGDLDEQGLTRAEYEGPVEVRSDSEYTVRAWMAVMTYLLTDYQFLYE